jgi:monovalent cation:H+ antiporter-2, CPA2 family
MAIRGGVPQEPGGTMGGDFLQDTLIVLAAAVVLVPLAHWAGVGAVVGYLVAGAAIGPHGLGFVANVAAVDALGQFGVIILLFTVGLELPFGRMAAMRRYMFGLGGAQVAATTLVIGVVAAAAGLAGDAALVIGAALALSSTAVVVQLLTERKQTTARFARAAIAVLLLQDLAVAPLLTLVPILGAGAGGIVQALGLAGLQAALAIVPIIVVGLLVVRPLYRVIVRAGRPEVVLAASLLLVVGTVWGAGLAGLSAVLAAFLAGMLLAETEFRHQIESDVLPFRGLLAGLYFISVGMSVDTALVGAQALTIAGLALALIVVKSTVLAGLCRAYGLDWIAAARVGLLLAQGGEFAFIVLSLAVGQKILPESVGQILVAVVALTLLLTPALAQAGEWLSRRFAGAGAAGLARPSDDGGLAGHIVIAGFGRVGHSIAELLAARGVPFLAVDRDVDRVSACRAAGHPVHFGDVSRADLLATFGIDRARAAVVTTDDAEAAERAVAALRRHQPGLTIIARARDWPHGERLRAAGASVVVVETVEASLQIAAAALTAAGVAAEDVARIVQEFRRDDYAKMSGSEGAPG